MVDRDGKFTYSSIRVVNLNTTNEVLTLATYPNPVQDQLQVTFPKTWEQKEVTIEIYSNNGQVVRRQVSRVASQTESVRLSDLKSGLYTIKVYSGTEVAVSKIVKK